MMPPMMMDGSMNMNGDATFDMSVNYFPRKEKDEMNTTCHNNDNVSREMTKMRWSPDARAELTNTAKQHSQ